MFMDRGGHEFNWREKSQGTFLVTAFVLFRNSVILVALPTLPQMTKYVLNNKSQMIKIRHDAQLTF